MPKTKRDSSLYRRGQYRLDWDRRADGSLRSPFLSVFWYDPARRRERSASTRTAELEPAKRWLDAFYLEQTTGQAVCHACGQAIHSAAGYLVTSAIAAYQLDHGDKQSSAKAISARLGHVVDYIASLPTADATCDQVDERWIAGFRKWAEKVPVMAGAKERARSLSTIEGSVAQLQAAINHAWRRGDTRRAAAFKPIPIRELNRTPQHRSGIDQLAAMFAYCVSPQRFTKETISADQRLRTINERAALRRFLILAVASLGRPDAIHDVSLAKDRRQWNSQARILALNPAGRRQTKKYRAVVPIAWQAALHLDAEAGKEKPGFFVGPKSVRKAWEAMAVAIKLPVDGEAGTKLIRRSMADLLRQRLPEEAWGEIEMFLGHAKFDQISDLYAPFKPTYLKRAQAAIEGIIVEIETLAPGAFHRSCTGEGADVITLAVAKNA